MTGMLANKKGAHIFLAIALDKMFFFNPKVLIFFLFLQENICCGYSLEAPRWGASNEYPQHIFVENWEKYLPDTPTYLALMLAIT